MQKKCHSCCFKGFLIGKLHLALPCRCSLNGVMLRHRKNQMTGKRMSSEKSFQLTFETTQPTFLPMRKVTRASTIVFHNSTALRWSNELEKMSAMLNAQVSVPVFIFQLAPNKITSQDK